MVRAFVRTFTLTQGREGRTNKYKKVGTSTPLPSEAARLILKIIREFNSSNEEIGTNKVKTEYIQISVLKSTNGEKQWLS